MTEKKQFTVEFLIKTSPKILYNRLATPSGLSEWFADDVTEKNSVYSFRWNDVMEKARLLSKKTGENIRFQWTEDSETDYFFDFNITVDPLTNDVALIITDHAEEDEIEEARLLWERQVNDLIRLLGA